MFYHGHIAGKFGGGSLANLMNPPIKLKSSKLVLTINNHLAHALIRQTFSPNA